jgi:bifunctional N-acetylglucosamine-1-phosphate-uridyltransferase/glucosamine-1-phosphate-acetyltransferase GlmU-like protein
MSNDLGSAIRHKVVYIGWRLVKSVFSVAATYLYKFQIDNNAMVSTKTLYNASIPESVRRGPFAEVHSAEVRSAFGLGRNLQ